MIHKVLSIHTSPARMGFDIQKPKMEINSGKLDKLELSTKLPKLEMNTSLVKVEIDQSDCFAECGLKSVARFSADEASEAKSIGMEAIGTIVSQGNSLADIHLGGNPIPDNAEQNRFEQFVYDTNLVTMPTSRPRITVREGSVTINVKEGRVDNNTVVDMPKINYTKGSVKAYMKDYGKVDISVVDKEI